MNDNVIDNLDCYTLDDQPMVCGECGARTDFIESGNTTQRHQCLNINCGYKFLSIISNFMYDFERDDIFHKI